MVDEGLSPGQQVITAGQYKVSPGTLVSTAVASSDAAQAEGPGRNERRHFRALHPLPHRHLAADGGHSVCRPRRLSAAAGRAAAAGRLPDHPDHRQPARRQSGDHGDLGRAAAGAPVCADSRHRADDLDELSRHRCGHDPVRPQPHQSMAPPTTCRPRSTPPAGSCRRTCPRRRPTARSTRRIRRSCCCRQHRTRCR